MCSDQFLLSTFSIEVPWTLNRFASVCPRVFERAFGNEVLLENLSLAFWSQTHTHTHTYIYIYIYIYKSFVPFQNGLKICVFSKSFFWNFSLVIDYRFLVIDYTFIFWRVMTFKLNFKSSVAGNRLHINGITNFKFKFPNPSKSWFSKLSFGNRLHCLVIDY